MNLKNKLKKVIEKIEKCDQLGDKFEASQLHQERRDLEAQINLNTITGLSNNHQDFVQVPEIID